MRAILIGKASNGNSFTFYHLPSKKTFILDDFMINKNCTSGSTFNLPYNGLSRLQKATQ